VRAQAAAPEYFISPSRPSATKNQKQNYATQKSKNWKAQKIQIPKTPSKIWKSRKSIPKIFGKKIFYSLRHNFFSNRKPKKVTM
jgi:hypothetical protein